MRKSTRSLAAIAAALALLAAACGGDDDDAADDTTAAGDTAAADTAAADTVAGTEPAGTDVAATEPAGTGTSEPAGTRAAGENPFGGTLAEGEFGESYLPDPALLEQALGGAASLPEDDMQRNIALAGVARASIAVDEDLALKCWQDNGCDTGTGGELKVGLADGFGGNVARQLFKMEFILQALTYPEIGTIAYTDANLDAQKAISDVRSLVAQDFDVILSYPDAGEALRACVPGGDGRGFAGRAVVERQHRRTRHRLPDVQRIGHLRDRDEVRRDHERSVPRRRADRVPRRDAGQHPVAGVAGLRARGAQRQHRGR